MKFGSSYHTGRASLLWIVAAALFGFFSCVSAAQNPATRRQSLVQSPVGRFPMPLGIQASRTAPLRRVSRQAFEDWTKRATFAAANNTPTPAPPAVLLQYRDLTTNPRPPLIGPSTKSIERHPFWSWDQQYLYFASNNINPDADYGTTQPPANAAYHVYRMTSDGSFVQRITGLAFQDEVSGSQLHPALNFSQTKLAYTHRSVGAESYQIFVYDLISRQRVQLTGIPVAGHTLNQQLVDVQRPTWAPGDALIVFAARNRNVPGDPLNIYVVDVVTRVVRQLTFSPAAGDPAAGMPEEATRVNCKDPFVHPDAGTNTIVFAANTGAPGQANVVNPATGQLSYQLNPLRNHRGNAPIDPDYNLFTISLDGATAGRPIRQLTFDVSDDVEPAVNRSVYPPGAGFGAFNNYIAFSSLGRNAGPTYDIYYFNGGPVTGGNPAIRLFSPDSDANANPLHQTDERYPTWSSGLPPQNPMDRVAFSSNRQNNVANIEQPTFSSVDRDIWVSEARDITPPTLFPFDEKSGEVLHISNLKIEDGPGSRVGLPGDTFYFYARLKDGQYGVESVWVQIKDPDGASTDAQGQNRKLFSDLQPDVVRRQQDGAQGAAATHWLWTSVETDSSGIHAQNYSYYSDGPKLDGASAVARARYASYIPGVDDSVAWSGYANRPPQDAAGIRWLELKDDGTGNDLVPGDGVYSAEWRTPTVPSDFYVDLIAYDKAFNPYDPTETSNWVMYDNIWGFSTQRFVGKHPVLLVDDYGAGQKWPRGFKGSFRPFPTYRYGTESDIIDRPDIYLPRWSLAGAATSQPVTDAATGEPPRHFLIGDSVPYDYQLPAPTRSGALRAYRADVWRILAKGAVPEDVLNNYTPTVEQQPTDITGTSTVDRPIPVRAIVWNAPYTGDVFSGAGTILDKDTQNLLTQFHNRAGRLIVAGGDILWAMTAGGAVQNQPFVQNVLGANFLGDNAPGNSAHDFSGGALATTITQDVFGNYAPLPNPPFWWGPEYDPDPLGAASIWPDVPSGPNTNAGNNRQRGAAADGTPFQNQDGVSARAGWDQVYNNRMIANQDAATRSKTVFMSFSLASMGRRYLAQDDDDPLYTLNYRGKVSHAILCWMFSVELQGQVRNLNGNAPIAGALVELLVGNQVVGSALTRPDGSYSVRGLPVGGWGLRVTNPGFQAYSKATGNDGHGLSQELEDVYMIPAAPGSISGKVVDQDGQAVPNVDILATLQASNLYTGQRLFTARTGLDGTYKIPSAPVGDYLVDIVTPLPTGFQNPTKNFAEPVTVQTQQDVSGIDFAVEGLPGPLKVEVFTQNAQGGRGEPIPGAEVTLLDKTGAVLSNLTGQTGADGAYDIPAVPAGPITVTAWKLGFQEGSKVVAIPQQNQVEILLAPGRQQSLYGLAVRKLDGQPLTAEDLRSDGVTLQLVRRVSRQPVGVNLPVFAPPQDMPEQHNYTGTAYEGAYSVALIGHPRFKDASVDVVVPGDASASVSLLELEGKDGILSGTVKESGSNNPVEGAQIEIMSQTGTPGMVVATATTGADGRWQTAQALVSGLYQVTAKRWGYADGTKSDIFVAGDTDAGEILLDRAPRGSLYGLVRRAIDNQPRENVTLEFWTTPTASIGVQKVAQVVTSATQTAGPDGGPQNYTIGDVVPSAEVMPEGDYEVRVTGDPRFADFTGRVTVVGGTATRYDVTLNPLPGVLQGYVFEDDGTGNPGPAVENASVRISGATTVTLTTDTQGRYVTANPMPAGPYTITASNFGFIDGTVSAFVEGPVTAPVILLRRQPPGTIRGNVRSKVGDQELISGATVELVDVSTNTVVMTTSSNASQTGNPLANYQLTSVPPGNYRLRAKKAGWIQTELGPFTLNPDVTLNGMHLLLSPEYTFGRGLLMISLPDDYSGRDAASVLGIPTQDLRAAVYKTEERQYAIYPAAPAHEFRQGRAMFVRFTKPTAFSNVGTPTANVPFYLPVKAGWNMIGSVRKQRIEWLRVQVVAGDGTQYTMQEAMDAGIVQNGLYTYVDNYFRVDFLDPYVGYFMRARQDCTLIIPVNNSAVSVTPEERAKVAAMPMPSIEAVAAEIAAAGLGPAQPPARVSVERKQNKPRWQLFGLPKGMPSLWNGAAELWPWKPGLG